MGKIKNNKLAITVVLLMLIVLVATTLFAVLFNNDGNTVQAYEINTNARYATIGDHGVGEAEHLVQGQESDVRNRFGVGSDYSVVWVYTASELRQQLETASGAKADAGANKIIILGNDIDWEQSSMTSDVGSQKFVGILDGNGYKLNINFSATLYSTGKIKGNKGGNDAYYKVTESDVSGSSNNFPADNGDGVRGVGLVVGVNAGTIANLTVNYTAAEGAMRDGGTVNDNSTIDDTNSLDSAESPDCPYGYGIVTGVNIGTIDNVYVNQQSIFNGNTKNGDDGTLAAVAKAYTNCSAVGGIAGVNMGFGVINNCYMYVGGQLWAQADGCGVGGNPAKFSAAFAGGITGWIKGDNAQITYCYLDGTADINAWAQRGKNKGSAGLQSSVAWSLAYAGGITAGKLKFVELDNLYYAEPTGMGANQVKGIISNWTGYRRDSYGKTSYVDVAKTFSSAARATIATPFDYLYSADQGSDKQDLVIFTFNYKKVTGNDTLDLTHSLESSTLSPAKMNANWIEVYGWDHSLYTSEGDSQVSITFEGNYLRVQAESKSFMEGRDVQLDSITRSSNPNGYRPTYDNTFQGCMIWGVDIYSIESGVNPETVVTSTVNKPTDKMGSFVQYYSSTMAKGTYVVKFGATYDYSITGNITTTRQYNGQPISDMLPTMRLTGAGGAVTPSDSCYVWTYTGAKAGVVDQSETIYPDTYYVQPSAIVEGEANSAYAYYDATQRTLAVSKGLNSTVIVTNATLSLNYTASGWTKSATIPVTFSANNSTNWNTTIIDAYSYQGGATTEIIPLNLTGTNNFTITETETTPRNGRTIYNVKAYVKKADGTYVEVADTTKATTDQKTAVIKIDNAVPILASETYYLADQFGEASVDEIGQLLAQNPENYTALDTAEVLAGRWYNQNIIAVAEVSDENRSGVSQDTVGVQEAVVGGSLGNMNEDNYVTTVDGNGNARIVMLIPGARTIQISVSDALGNFASFALNGGGFVNIDTTPITFSAVLDGQQFSVSYGFRLAWGKAFDKLGVNFIPNFGGAGLSAWYYIDNNTTLGDDVMTPPEGVQWTKYEFDSTVVSGSENSILIPEGMENAAVFVMFTSGVEGYEVADPVIVRLVSNPYSKFTVDLNRADITVNAQYVTVSKASTGENYNLAELVSGIDGVSLSEFFSKTYDGTNGAGKYSPDGTSYVDDITFSYTIPDDVKPEEGQFWSGWFYASTEKDNFRTSWLKFTMEYTEVNSGSCYLNLSLTTSDASPIDMSITVAYDGNLNNGKKTYAIATTIERINMVFDIGQIFSEGSDIVLSAGSYTLGEGGTVTFNWVYGNVFDGLVATIKNDESGGTMSFRFKSQGKNTEKYMNVGGVYSAYVDAIKIDSPVYQMDDFAVLVKSGDSYVGDAGDNYTVSISGSIPINVTAREVRLTFALDGATGYSFNIPYDGTEHVVTAGYTDVDGNFVYATVTWKNSAGSDTTLTAIKDIGTYTAVAKISDTNYTLVTGGQYQQRFSILATYLDVSVPDKVVQYNDGGAIKYIPDLDDKYSDEIKNNVVFTIIYYEKLGTGSLRVMTNPDGSFVDHVTDVGVYYVSVVFDPERAENQAVEELSKFARKEYTRAESGTQGTDEQYIMLTVTKADTVITGVSDRTNTYNKMLQWIDDWSDAKVKSAGTQATLGSASVKLQYRDDDSNAYVDFDESSNNGKYLNVGEYSYRLVYDGDTNYNASTLDLKMTITTAKISGVVFGGTITGETVIGIKEEYTGGAFKLEADISGSNLVGEAGVVIEYGRGLIYTKTAPEYTIVGRNEVKLRITCPNFETYETSAFVIITTAEYPEKENPITFVKGQDVEVEYTGKEQSVEYTLNKDKFSSISVMGELKATDVGVYDGEIMVMIPNYESKTYEVTLTITAPKVTSVDTSVISQIANDEGLTSDTDLMRLEATFEGVDGEAVQAELVFKNSAGEIVTPDSYGCLPAGDYTVTFQADNYDLSGVSSYKLTLAQGTGERVCDHEDKNGDGICDKCGQLMGSEDCSHVDEDGDGKCDLCGASIGNVTQPKDAPDAIVIIVIAVCGVVIVASVAGVIVAAVKRSKKKNNRYNII